MRPLVRDALEPISTLPSPSLKEPSMTRTAIYSCVVLAMLLVLVSSAPAQRPAAEGQATMTIKLPANATLTIGGHATGLTGSERIFVSPPLKPGKTYTYQFKAT